MPRRRCPPGAGGAFPNSTTEPAAEQARSPGPPEVFGCRRRRRARPGVGGPFDAMTAIHDAMRVIACDVATTYVGQAASTAALPLAAGAPGKRAALPGTRVVLTAAGTRRAPAGPPLGPGGPRPRGAEAAGVPPRAAGTAHRPRPRRGGPRPGAGTRRDRRTGARPGGPCRPRPPEPAARPPEPPPRPALTREGAHPDACLDAVDQPRRPDPARATHTYGALRAARALVAGAEALRAALTPRHGRSGAEVHARTLGRALRAPDGERRTAHVTLPHDRCG